MIEIEYTRAAQDHERYTLGSMLYDPKAMADALQVLDAQDFGSELNAAIFEAIKRTAERREPVEVASVANELRAAPVLDERGRPTGRNWYEHIGGDQTGRTFLLNLMDAPTSAANVGYYAGIVKREAKQRTVQARSLEAFHLAKTADGMEQIAASNGRYQLAELAARSGKQVGLATVTLSDVKAEKVQWLWRGLIPFAKISVWQGNGGLGKSFALMDIAARLSAGKPMPFCELVTHPPADVLMLLAEDGAGDTVRPRMEAAGADLSRIHVLPVENATNLLHDLAAIEVTIRQKNIRLMIIDPIMSFLPANISSFNDQEIRRVLTPLIRLAAALGVAIVYVNHLNKAGGMSAMQRGGGSMAFVNAARKANFVGVDPADPEKRILAHLKGNLGREPPSLRFHIEAIDEGDEDSPARLIWDGIAEGVRADDLTAPAASPAATQNKIEEAQNWLREILSNGPLPSSELDQRAADAGIRHETLKRAKKGLVRAQQMRDGKRLMGWFCSLLEADTEGGLEGQQIQEVQGSCLTENEPLEPLDIADPFIDEIATVEPVAA